MVAHFKCTVSGRALMCPGLFINFRMFGGAITSWLLTMWMTVLANGKSHQFQAAHKALKHMFFIIIQCNLAKKQQLSRPNTISENLLISIWQTIDASEGTTCGQTARKNHTHVPFLSHQFIICEPIYYTPGYSNDVCVEFKPHLNCRHIRICLIGMAIDNYRFLHFFLFVSAHLPFTIESTCKSVKILRELRSKPIEPFTFPRSLDEHQILFMID